MVSPSPDVTRVPAPGGQTQLCPPDLFCRFSQILKSVSQLKIAQMFSQTFEKGRESLLKVLRVNVKVFVQNFSFFGVFLSCVLCDLTLATEFTQQLLGEPHILLLKLIVAKIKFSSWVTQLYSWLLKFHS